MTPQASGDLLHRVDPAAPGAGAPGVEEPITIDVTTSGTTESGQIACADGLVVADAVTAVWKWTSHSR